MVPIAAATGEGIGDLVVRLAQVLPDAETLARPGEPAGVIVHRLETARDSFSVEQQDGLYVVMGRRIERIAAQTDFENEESAERFQRDLARLGVERELLRLGIEPGDTVRIGQVELEWQDDMGIGEPA